jgi:hypothetical protein
MINNRGGLGMARNISRRNILKGMSGLAAALTFPGLPVGCGSEPLEYFGGGPPTKRDYKMALVLLKPSNTSEEEYRANLHTAQELIPLSNERFNALTKGRITITIPDEVHILNDPTSNPFNNSSQVYDLARVVRKFNQEYNPKDIYDFVTVATSHPGIPNSHGGMSRTGGFHASIFNTSKRVNNNPLIKYSHVTKSANIIGLNFLGNLASPSYKVRSTVPYFSDEPKEKDIEEGIKTED